MGTAWGRGGLCCPQWMGGWEMAGMGLAPVAQSVGLVLMVPPVLWRMAEPAGSGGLCSVVPDHAPALFTFIVAGWGFFCCIFSNAVIWEMCNSAFNNF